MGATQGGDKGGETPEMGWEAVTITQLAMRPTVVPMGLRGKEQTQCFKRRNAGGHCDRPGMAEESSLMLRPDSTRSN